MKLRSSLPEKESEVLYKRNFTPMAPLEMWRPCHTPHLISSAQHVITELLKAGYGRNAKSGAANMTAPHSLSSAVSVYSLSSVLEPPGVSPWLNCSPSFENSVASYVLNAEKYLQPRCPAVHIWDSTCRPKTMPGSTQVFKH